MWRCDGDDDDDEQDVGMKVIPVGCDGRHDEFEIHNIDTCMAAPAALHLPMNMCQMRCKMAAVTSSIQWTYSAFWRLYPETQWVSCFIPLGLQVAAIEARL